MVEEVAGVPRRNRETILAHLRSHERGRVCDLLLKRHPELREEANAIAKDLLADVSVEDISQEVVYLVSSVGLDSLNVRSGKHYWGYVGPTEAAWELLWEAIEDIQNDMVRRNKAGLRAAAERICQGIILGLQKLDVENTDGVLGWAPDFPGEAAAHTLSMLLELYPRNHRRAAGSRVLVGLEQQVGEWVGMLVRVMEHAASQKRL